MDSRSRPASASAMPGRIRCAFSSYRNFFAATSVHAKSRQRQLAHPEERQLEPVLLLRRIPQVPCQAVPLSPMPTPACAPWSFGNSIGSRGKAPVRARRRAIAPARTTTRQALESKEVPAEHDQAKFCAVRGHSFSCCGWRSPGSTGATPDSASYRIAAAAVPSRSKRGNASTDRYNFLILCGRISWPASGSSRLPTRRFHPSHRALSTVVVDAMTALLLRQGSPRAARSSRRRRRDNPSLFSNPIHAGPSRARTGGSTTSRFLLLLAAIFASLAPDSSRRGWAIAAALSGSLLVKRITAFPHSPLLEASSPPGIRPRFWPCLPALRSLFLAVPLRLATDLPKRLLYGAERLALATARQGWQILPPPLDGEAETVEAGTVRLAIDAGAKTRIQPCGSGVIGRRRPLAT